MIDTHYRSPALQPVDLKLGSGNRIAPVSSVDEGGYDLGRDSGRGSAGDYSRGYRGTGEEGSSRDRGYSAAQAYDPSGGSLVRPGNDLGRHLDLAA